MRQIPRHDGGGSALATSNGENPRGPWRRAPDPEPIEKTVYVYATDLAAQRIRAEIRAMDEQIERRRRVLRALYRCGARRPRRAWRHTLCNYLRGAATPYR